MPIRSDRVKVAIGPRFGRALALAACRESAVADGALTVAEGSESCADALVPIPVMGEEVSILALGEIGRAYG